VGRSAAGWALAPLLGSLAGGAGAAPVVLVAIIGMLAAIAIPNYVKFQLRNQEAAGKAALQALHQAEVAHFGRTGGYQALRTPDQLPGATAMAWGAADLAAAGELGWQVDGESHHTFAVEVGETENGRQAFATCAESDLDGDGTYAAWVTWEPVEDLEGDLVAPRPPCRHATDFTRSLGYQADDAPGAPVKVTSPDTL